MECKVYYDNYTWVSTHFNSMFEIWKLLNAQVCSPILALSAICLLKAGNNSKQFKGSQLSAFLHRPHTVLGHSQSGVGAWAPSQNPNLSRAPEWNDMFYRDLWRAATLSPAQPPPSPSPEPPCRPLILKSQHTLLPVFVTMNLNFAILTILTPKMVYNYSKILSLLREIGNKFCSF